jgi:hypothetical protein
LREERQAAVEAVLTAGHIPAGMELFAAGDESQMNAIKRWIDASDVYMLILGGRYGSIEPKTDKSYIQLEYEYAVEIGKPLFAVVIDENHLEEKVKKHGSSVIEREHSEKLKQFREIVCRKLVRFWSDSKDIELSIMETMADFSNRTELIGWIPGNEAVNKDVVEQIAKLSKENTELRQQASMPLVISNDNLSLGGSNLSVDSISLRNIGGAIAKVTNISSDADGRIRIIDAHYMESFVLDPGPTALNVMINEIKIIDGLGGTAAASSLAPLIKKWKEPFSIYVWYESLGGKDKFCTEIQFQSGNMYIRNLGWKQLDLK